MPMLATAGTRNWFIRRRIVSRAAPTGTRWRRIRHLQVLRDPDDGAPAADDPRVLTATRPNFFHTSF